MAKHFTQQGETTIGGVASDNLPRHAVINDKCHTMIAMDPCQNTILMGYHYFLYAKATLANAGVQEYLITTPDTTTWAHMSIDTSGSAITQFDIYEDSGFAGTTDNELTPYNSNRNSSSLATTRVFTTPTTDTDEGTLIRTFKGGSSSQQSRSATGSETERTLILKQNSNYLVRFTSASDNNFVNMDLYWAEFAHKS